MSKTHYAYCYGKAIFGSEYEKYLPEYYLAYGQYWADLVNTPSKKRILGNPFLTGNDGTKGGGQTSADKKMILIISSGLNPEAMTNLALELQNKISHLPLEICFRPHPLEISLIKDRYQRLLDKNIRFSSENP